MGNGKKKVIVNLLLFLLFVTLISSLAFAWSPQDDIDLKYRLNIVNDTAGSCDTGYVVQGRLQNGSWNCALATSFDSNETDRVDALVTANVSTNSRIDSLNSSYNGTSLIKDDDNYLSVNHTWLESLFYTISQIEVFNTSLYSIFYTQTQIESFNTSLYSLFYERSSLYNKSEIESMNTSIRNDLSDTNETDRVDELVLANVSTNLRIVDLNGTFLAENVTLWAYFSNYYSITQIESMNDSLRVDLADTNETDNVEELILANVSTNGRIDDLNSTKIETSEEGNLDVNTSLVSYDLENYNTTTLLKDDDSYLSVDQTWLDGLYLSIVNFEIFNTSLYTIFYTQAEIELMNTTLTNEDSRINTELLNLESNFTNENTSVWNNITNAEIDITSNLAYLDNLQSNFTAQNETNYLEFINISGDGETIYNNLTMADDYYLAGQPLDGSLGSGIIWINGTTQFSELNVTCTGLSCSYVAFKVRLVTTSNEVTYCDIPAGSFNAVDNQHTVAYIDENCDVQLVSIQDYITTFTSPGGQPDFANVIVFDGETENVNGLGLENKRQIKLRKLLLLSTGQHLSVVNGFTYQTNGFSGFNITSGNYVYLYDIVPTGLQDTATDGIHMVYHTGVGTWEENNQSGLNLTSCDTGTGTATCSTPSKYRRHFIFILGNNDSGTDETTIHQLLPLQSTTYVSSADCLDTENNPLSYTLPEQYEYGAVMLYAYCGRASDSTWVNEQFIDLRTTKTGTSQAVAEGIYVKADGSTPLTSNWNVGAFTITANNFSGYLDCTNIFGNSSDLCTLVDTDTDTNETTRFNTLVGTDCDGTDKMTGVDADGTIVCEADETSAGGNPKAGVDYLYNDSASIYWNDTKGNNTYVTYDNLTDLDQNFTDGYNATQFDTDDDGYLHIVVSYLTGLFYQKSEVYTQAVIELMNTTLTSADTLLNGRADDLNFTDLAGLNTRLSDAVLVDTGTMTNTNWCKYNSASTDITCDVTPVVDTTCDGESCTVTNDGTLGGFTGAQLNVNTNCSTSGGCATLYVGTNAVIHAASSWSGGDLGGTGLAATVTDDSHNHVGTNIDAGTFNTGEYIFPNNVSVENLTVGGNGGGLIYWNGSHTIIS